MCIGYELWCGRDGGEGMKCSACGYPVSRWTGNTNFCPNCGADMRDQEGEE